MPTGAESAGEGQEPLIIATFYRFARLPDYREMRNRLLHICQKENLKGTILLAREGVNATIAGSGKAVNRFMEYLAADSRFRDLPIKESVCYVSPFYRMKVKIKKEIVTMGQPDIDPVKKNGQKVDVTRWNDLIRDPDVLVLDTRNQYEFEIGTFENAVSPVTGSFTEFPGYVRNHLAGHKQKKIAMFCTGGIRCEKATAWMLEQGFEQVFHLDGGILKYLEEVSPEKNLWQGECFVFDNRVAVDENLQKGSHTMCYGCRMPVSPEDRKSEKYEEGVSCPRCYDDQDSRKKQNLRQRQFQVSLADERGMQHIGTRLDN